MSDPKTENVASALPGSDVIGEYVADFLVTANRLADALERIAGAIRSAAEEGERLTKTLREELPPISSRAREPVRPYRWRSLGSRRLR